MKKHMNVIPEGSRDFLFEECLARRYAEKLLTNVYAMRGYQEVDTPDLEFSDLFSEESFGISPEAMYRLFDDKGRLMTLRPDSTLPIARLAATRLLNHPTPIRLCYNHKIYRNMPTLRGKSHQVHQAGIELLGEGGKAADLEVIVTAIEALAPLIPDFTLELGHAGFFDTISALPEIPENLRAEIRCLMETKNFADLNHLLDTLPESMVSQALRKLPELFGGEEVLTEAMKLVDDPEARRTISYLSELYHDLTALGYKDRISIDLGFVNRLGYYTGIIFQGYTGGYGGTILSGGRYDKLLGKFGRPMEAIGFTVNVDAVADILLDNGIIEGHTLSENTEICEDKKRPIRIALTKGRLEKNAAALFEYIGIDCTSLHNKGRKLILHIGENLEAVLAKAPDVPTYVEHGVCDIGIVGKDTILELPAAGASGGSFYEMLDLEFGKCRFALAAPDSSDFYAGHRVKVIATKYPNVTRAFFDEKGMDIRIIKIEGSVELTPLLQLADGIVDIVESGSTLKENGLSIIEEIMPISARLIVNTSSLKTRKTELEELIGKLAIAVKERKR